MAEAAASVHQTDPDQTDRQPTAPPTPPLRDASARQLRYPDPGPLDAETFAAIVRQPIRIGEPGRRAADRHKITAGGLNTLLRALRTLATHATADAIVFRRRPADVIAEFDFARRPFYAHAKAAEELGHLTRQPAGKRGVVEYRMPRAVRTVALLATSSANGATARATSSANGATARSFPLLTDQDDHHHHQEELASRNQIRKACALDRAAGRSPNEARYAAMSRTALWDLIEEREHQPMGRPEPAPVPEPAPSAEELAKRRDHRRELLDQIATREQLIDHHDPKVRAVVAAELQTLRTELELVDRPTGTRL